MIGELRIKNIENDIFFYWLPHMAIWGYTNQIGKYFLESLVENQSESDIIQSISEKYNVDRDVVKEDFDDFKSLMKEKGFYDDIADVEKRVKQEPCKITFLLTERCNLKCKHCYQGDMHSENFDISNIYLTLKNLRTQLNVGDLILTGGEVTILKDLKEIVDYVNNLEFKHVQFLSNGTMFTDDLALFLSTRVNMVQISLDGANEQSHDYIRGIGNFKKSIAALESLTKYFAPERLTISFTTMQHNLGEINELINLALDLGVGNLHFPHFIPAGNGKTNYDSLKLNLNERIKYWTQLYELSRKGEIGEKVLSVWRKTNIQDFFSRLVPFNNYLSCGFAKRVLNVRFNGDIYPCTWLALTEFKLGNINDEYYSDILKSTIYKKLSDSNFSRIRNNKSCKNCFYNLVCQSGCMGIAYHQHGDLSKKADSICAMTKFVFDLFLKEGINVS